MNRLIAVSDIHGCFETFYRLVISNLRLRKSDRLILLGDYIDRGCRSREVLDLIIDLSTGGYDITALTGNHEWMLLEALKNNDMLPLWLLNSGSTTIKSFNIDNLNDLDLKYIAFLKSMKYYYKSGKCFFVHAGFNDSLDDPFTDYYRMLWECQPEYTSKAFSGRIIIHGHRRKTSEQVRSLLARGHNVIPIDTGCVYEKESGYGLLSALVINTMTLVSEERTDQVNTL